MKRRNFFKALGGLAIAPVAAKAAPGGSGGEKIVPYKTTDPILPSYERETYQRHAGYDYLNIKADFAEIVTRNNAILARLKGRAL